MRFVLITLIVGAIAASGCSPETETVTEPQTNIDSWDVQGHRGARGIRPENTLPSFEAALDAGVSTLELDVHLSADDIPVIWHDPRVDSTKCRGTDSSLPSADEEPLVRDLTAAQLATYICDLNPNPGTYPDQTADSGDIAGDSYGIATLQDLFEMVSRYAASDSVTQDQRSNAGTVLFNIELKRDPRNPNSIGDSFDGTNPAEFETALADSVTAWGYEDRVIVQSFDHRSLWALHTLAPSIRLASLTFEDIPDLADLAIAGASIWSPRHSMLSADLVAAATEAGLDVIPWTVNKQDDVCALLAMGTAGIITDRPDLVLGTDGWLADCDEG